MRFESVPSAPYLGVAQMVACYLGVVEAVGSNPATQTMGKSDIDLPIFYFKLVVGTVLCRNSFTVNWRWPTNSDDDRPFALYSMQRRWWNGVFNSFIGKLFHYHFGHLRF